MPTPKLRGGVALAESLSFTKAHGAAPQSCEITAPGQVSMARNDLLYILVGSSLWSGLCVDVQRSLNNQTGITSTVRCIDFRDRLFSVTVFARFNIIDERTGEVYSRVSTTLYPTETFNLQAKISARKIVEWLASASGFRVTYSFAATQILKSEEITNWQNSRFNVYNLDWSDGIKVGPALDQVLDLLGLQLTIAFDVRDTLRITRKGVADSSDIQWTGLLSNSTKIGACLQSDVDTGVWIVGDRDQYEFRGVVLRPTWNSAWEKYYWDSELLNTDLTKAAQTNSNLVGNVLVDLVGDFLPDPGFLDYRHFFNNMTIHEYLSSVPYMLYRIQGMENILQPDEFLGKVPVREVRISPGLPTEPGRDYRVYAHGIDKRSKYVVLPVQTTSYYVPLEDGYTVHPDTGIVKFNEPRFVLTPAAIAAKKVTLSVDDVAADTPFIDVTILGKTYRTFHGTEDRIGSKKVNGLFRTFVVQDPGDPNPPDPADPAYRDPSNPKSRTGRIAGDPVVNPGQNAVFSPIPEAAVPFILAGERGADDTADDIAASYLDRPRVLSSGEETFEGFAGHEPSGQIHRVTVTLDNEGIKESVSYANDEVHPSYEPLIETRRKIAVDSATKRLEVVRKQIERNITSRAIKLARQAGTDPLHDYKNTNVKIAMEALNRDNHVMVQPAGNDTYAHGEPVCGFFDGTNINANAKSVTDSADAEFIGVTAVSHNGGRVAVVTHGVTHALVTGPVNSGDTLDVSQGGGSFKAGDGQAVALADVTGSGQKLIPVRLHGGKASQGVVTVDAVFDSPITSPPSNTQNGDTIACGDGFTALLTNQADPAENGVWQCKTAGKWSKASEFQPSVIFVWDGSVYRNDYFVLTNDNTFTNQIRLVDAVSTADISSLQNSATIDGVTLPNVTTPNIKYALLAGQNTTSQNGVYIIKSSGPWIYLGQPQCVDVKGGKINLKRRFILTAKDVYSPCAPYFEIVDGASTVQINTLSGLSQSVDGSVTLNTEGMKVLLKNQSTDPTQNGVYIVRSTAWIYLGQPRAVDVMGGNLAGQTRFILTGPNTYKGQVGYYG